MAISLDLLKSHCKQAEYEIVGEKEASIFFKHNDFTLAAQLRDDGKMFEMVSMGFLETEEAQKSEHKAAFMYHLLNFAWNTSFGTPELDKDGELRLLLEMPLEDNTLTLQQFKRIAESLITMSRRLSLEASSILATGELPEAATQNSSENGALLQLLAVLADPAAPGELKQASIQAANELLANEGTPQQLKVLIRVALGAGVPDSM